MGNSLTKEEELFQRGRFDLIVEGFAGPDTGEQSKTFAMSLPEWQAVAALCESDTPTATIVLREPDPGGGTTLLCPVAVCAVLVAASAAHLSGDAGIPVLSAPQVVAHLLLVKERFDEHCAGLPRPLPTAAEQQRQGVDVCLVAVEALAALSVPGALDTPSLAPVYREAVGHLADALSLAEKHPRPVLQLCLGFVGAVLACTALGLEAKAADTCFDFLSRAVSSAPTNVRCVEVVRDRANRWLLDRDLARMCDAPCSAPAAPAALTWDTLEERYVGQRHAVTELRDHFTARLRGLTPETKPTVAVFFGPSGHGKTELGRLLAEVLHGEGAEGRGLLVPIHMTSYCTRDSVYSLVDPPTAHVGEGILISAVRAHNDAVVVLDEFEKSSADAVQNVWLSAFPRGGMLRSLKDAKRSVSTEKLTFILTCNTCGDLINAAREEYVAATPSRQRAMRQRWTDACRAELQAQFGEPFTSRIDTFLPFAPYSWDERLAYVQMQLGSIIRRQLPDRVIHVTATFAESLAAAAVNFHGTTVHKAVQPHLLALSDPDAPSRTMLLHARRNIRGGFTTVSFIGLQQIQAASAVGARFAALWADPTSHREDPTSHREGAEPPTPDLCVGAEQAPEDPDTVDEACHPGPIASAATTNTAGHLETELCLETVREVELHQELCKERERCLALQREVETLRHTVKALEKLLGVLLVCVVVLLAFLSLFVSLSTLLFLVAAAVGGVFWFVENAGALVAAALRGLWKILGPLGAAALGMLLLAIVWTVGPQRCN